MGFGHFRETDIGVEKIGSKGEKFLPVNNELAVLAGSGADNLNRIFFPLRLDEIEKTLGVKMCMRVYSHLPTYPVSSEMVPLTVRLLLVLGRGYPMPCNYVNEHLRLT